MEPRPYFPRMASMVRSSFSCFSCCWVTTGASSRSSCWKESALSVIYRAVTVSIRTGSGAFHSRRVSSMAACQMSFIRWVGAGSRICRDTVRNWAFRRDTDTPPQYSSCCRSRIATLSDSTARPRCTSSQRVRFLGKVVPFPTDFTGSCWPAGRTGLPSSPLAYSWS